MATPECAAFVLSAPRMRTQSALSTTRRTRKQPGNLKIPHSCKPAPVLVLTWQGCGPAIRDVHPAKLRHHPSTPTPLAAGDRDPRASPVASGAPACCMSLSLRPAELSLWDVYASYQRMAL